MKYRMFETGFNITKSVKFVKSHEWPFDSKDKQNNILCKMCRALLGVFMDSDIRKILDQNSKCSNCNDAF